MSQESWKTAVTQRVETSISKVTETEKQLKEEVQRMEAKLGGMLATMKTEMELNVMGMLVCAGQNASTFVSQEILVGSLNCLGTCSLTHSDRGPRGWSDASPIVSSTIGALMMNEWQGRLAA